MNEKEPGVGPFKKNISYTSVALKKSLHACNVFEDGGDGGLAFYPNDTSLNSIEGQPSVSNLWKNVWKKK